MHALAAVAVERIESEALKVKPYVRSFLPARHYRLWAGRPSIAHAAAVASKKYACTVLIWMRCSPPPVPVRAIGKRPGKATRPD